MKQNDVQSEIRTPNPCECDAHLVDVWYRLVQAERAYQCERWGDRRHPMSHDIEADRAGRLVYDMRDNDLLEEPSWYMLMLKQLCEAAQAKSAGDSIGELVQLAALAQAAALSLMRHPGDVRPDGDAIDSGTGGEAAREPEAGHSACPGARCPFGAHLDLDGYFASEHIRERADVAPEAQHAANKLHDPRQRLVDDLFAVKSDDKSAKAERAAAWRRVLGQAVSDILIGAHAAGLFSRD